MVLCPRVVGLRKGVCASRCLPHRCVRYSTGQVGWWPDTDQTLLPTLNSGWWLETQADACAARLRTRWTRERGGRSEMPMTA